METANDLVRVIIADDREIYRAGLHFVLDAHFGHESCVIDILTSDQLREALNDQQRAVVIMRWDQIESMQSAWNHHRSYLENAAVLALIEPGMHLDPSTLLQYGVRGLLLKDSPSRSFIAAVEALHEGGFYFVDQEEHVMKHARNKRNPRAITHSALEKKIIKLICMQLTTKEIAAHLHSSSRTIEGYSQKIKEKIGARNMVGIALYAVRHKLLSFEEL